MLARRLIKNQEKLWKKAKNNNPHNFPHKKALKNNCITVRGWYIGHEAEQLNGKVRFITIGVNEPIEYDFTY